MATATWGPWKHLEACSLLCFFPKYLLLQKQHPATGAEGHSLRIHATAVSARGQSAAVPSLALARPGTPAILSKVCGKLVFACRQQLPGTMLGAGCALFGGS